jgi:hypothetical protein
VGRAPGQGRALSGQLIGSITPPVGMFGAV